MAALPLLTILFLLSEGARENLQLEQGKTKDALALAIKNEGLADKRREQTERLALRIEFEHYFSKAEDRPDLALVGMASLLPKAARLKDQAVVDSLRLQIGAWNGHAARLIAICANQDEVAAVALSLDGKTALTGSYDKAARLWETATGKPIGPPLQHQEWVVAVALSADGKTALTGSDDNTARL